MGRTNYSTLKVLIIVFAFFYCSIAIFYNYLYLLEEIENINNTTLNYTRNSGKLVNITAYNAGDENQCDNDPCISASGDNICKLLDMGVNVCAFNDVPFYTIIKVDSLGECVVLDRISSKYSDRLDWAMKKDEITKANNFGLKKLKIIITKKSYGKNF